MFTQKDFDIFEIPTVEARLSAIRAEIQPKFKKLGDELVDYLEPKVKKPMYLHIAQHLRRKVNPPKDTWLAISDYNRGYKSLPHFEVGLFEDQVFIRLGFIYDVKNKKEIGKDLLKNYDLLNSLPKNYVVTLDHMKKDVEKINQIDMKTEIERFIKVKKAELLFGVVLKSQEVVEMSYEDFERKVKSVFNKLIPVYNLF